MFSICIINPGSTSTKVAVYYGAENSKPAEGSARNIKHDPDILEKRKNPIDQLNFRIKAVEDFLEEQKIETLDAVVGRGGLVKPVPAGSYKITESMIRDLKESKYGSHASNLGALIADLLGRRFNCPAFITDPVGVDEFEPLARYSGFPGMERKCQSHALNIRAAARRAADSLRTTMFDLNLIVVHLGGGISVAPLKKGRIVDVNNANDGGPFSPQRTGSLPTTQLVNLCFSGKYGSAEELNHILTKKSGLLGYIGTDDGIEITERIKKGDARTLEVFEAMAYQISKEIGAMAAVLKGKADMIILTGGMAHPPLTEWIEEATKWIAPVKVYPGENEMSALAEAGLRYLSGIEELKDY
ncbi:MAG: butyrate kinase [Spirochaetes bacterium]|nr:butyrate kinase [Spirochaetota bacterium]